MAVAASSLGTAAVVADRSPASVSDSDGLPEVATNENMENATTEARDLVLQKRRSDCGPGM